MSMQSKSKILGVFTIGMTLFSFPASAQDEAAMSLFKEMSDYLTTQKSISTSYDATLEIVTAELQKVSLASSGSLTANRPDKVKMTRRGLADVEMVFDGKKLSFYGKNLNVYTSQEFEGTINDLIDTLRLDYGLDIPAADLLSTSPYDIMTSDVIDAKSMGSGVIRGQYCSHLLFRTPQVDWEVWVSEGEKPYPCRFTITSKMMAMAPSYTIEFSDWKAGADVAAADFTLKTDPDAKEVPVSDLQDAIDEIALIGGKGGSQ
jgi:hypothetical protein